MAIVDELVAILGFKVEGEADAKRFNEQLDKTEKSAGAMAKRLAAVGAAAGAAFAAGMIKLGSSVINVSAQFEGYEASLKTVLGSQEKAKAALSGISDFAKTTPYEVDGLTEAFIRLSTNGIDPFANDTLRILGDTASAMNKPIMQAVEALADAQTFSYERLKEFGIVSSTAGDEVTFAFQKNGETIKTTVKKDGEAIRNFLLDNFGSRFSGAMKEQSKTFNGMTSNLADSWTDFQKRIGEGGFFDAIKAELQGVLDYIAKLDADGTLTAIAQGISNGFLGAIKVTKQVAKALLDVGKAAYYVADGVVSMVAQLSGLSKGGALAGIVGGGALASVTGRKALMAVAKRVPAVGALLALEDIMSGLRGDDSLVGSTEAGAAALESLKTSAEDVGKAWNELINSLSGRQSEFTSFSNEVKALFSWNAEDSWMTILQTELATFVSDLSKIIQDITAGIEAITGAVNSVKQAVADAKDFVFGGGDDEGGASADTRTVAPGVTVREGSLAGTVAGWFLSDEPEPDAPPRRPDVLDATPSSAATVRRPDTIGASAGAGAGERIVAAVRDIGARIDTSRFGAGPDADGNISARPASEGNAELQSALSRIVTNMNRAGEASAVEAVTNDNRVSNDNRQFPVSVSAPVTVNVAQPTQAPAAVGRAVASAATQGATQQTRIAQRPAVSGNGPQ